ncbi:TetR/AcrR family transcriptional regulator [Streptomyces sp. NPDC008313]|uniref:TetR/AcrR family transcriptional regulator n=1 Tax=Streptomyces sp. NPDC008313 TaxID=3364826 RepID=UPI0036EC92C0
MGTGHTGTPDKSGGRARVPNRWGEGQRLRQEVLDAAGRLLKEASRPEDVSLRGIAREVGVTAPSIYKHFRDKSELLLAVLDDICRALAENMRQAAQSAPDSDPWAALRAAVDTYCRFATQQRQRYQLMFHIGPTLAEPQSSAGHPGTHVMKVWREVVQGYLNAPAVGSGGNAGASSLPAEDITRLLWSGLHGQFGIWWITTRDEPGQQRLVQLQNALLVSLFGRC